MSWCGPCGSAPVPTLGAASLGAPSSPAQSRAWGDLQNKTALQGTAGSVDSPASSHPTTGTAPGIAASSGCRVRFSPSRSKLHQPSGRQPRSLAVSLRGGHSSGPLLPDNKN